MKVYCEDCKYYWKGASSIIFPEWMWKANCWHIYNVEKNKNFKPIPLSTIGLFASSKGLVYAMSSYDDMYYFKKTLKELNGDNNCKWFEPDIEEVKWYQFKKKKRNKYLIEKYKEK